jgi:hypothetical protein
MTELFSDKRINVLWFLPTHGDGRYLGTSVGGRVTDLSYLRQIAEAVDRLGYHGVLLPTGKSCEDSWIVASALVTSTRQLRFLVAVRHSGTVSTLDRCSHPFTSSGDREINSLRSRKHVRKHGACCTDSSC